MAITRKAHVLHFVWLKGGHEVRSEKIGEVWLEDGQLRYSVRVQFVQRSAHVRFAATAEEAFENLLHWSNGYVGLEEVDVSEGVTEAAVDEPRSMAFVDVRYLRRTIGNAAWLDGLDDDQWRALWTEIVPVLLRAAQQRAQEETLKKLVRSGNALQDAVAAAFEHSGLLVQLEPCIRAAGADWFARFMRRRWAESLAQRWPARWLWLLPRHRTHVQMHLMAAGLNGLGGSRST